MCANYSINLVRLGKMFWVVKHNLVDGAFNKDEYNFFLQQTLYTKDSC